MTIAQKLHVVKNIEPRNQFSKIGFNSERYLLIVLFFFSIFAGATWPAGKIVVKNLSPLGGAFYRYSIALPMFVAISFLNRRNHNDSLLFGNDEKCKFKLHFKLAILGFLGVALYTVLFLEGVKLTSASDATMIFAMTPTLTVVIANFVIPDDKINRNKLFGLIFALIGVGIIFIQSPNTDVPNQFVGNQLILLSALVMAIHTVFSKSVFNRINVIDFSTWIIFYGWMFLLIPVMITNPEYLQLNFILDVEFKVILSIIYLAVFIVYATIVFAYGIKRLGPSRTAIFMNLIPVFGIISSIFILGEAFSFWYFPAFTAIMIGVYQVNKSTK